MQVSLTIPKVGSESTNSQDVAVDKPLPVNPMALNRVDDAVTNHVAKKNLSVIGKTSAVTIGGGAANDTVLHGITVLAALTGTCVITGFADSDDAATSITFPAATPAGFKDLKDAVNSAGALTVTCSNAADDNLVLVHWSAA